MLFDAVNATLSPDSLKDLLEQSIYIMFNKC